MKVIVCGLGWVGTTVAACLLRDGHTIVAVDIDASRRAAMAAGRAPVKEPRVGEMIAAGYAAGRLSAAANPAGHADADVAMICVGTPGLPDGTLDLSELTAVASSLGGAMALRAPERQPMLLVFRSTMTPGTMAGTVLPLLERAAGEPPGRRYEVVHNPVFFREGTAVEDYFAPPKIVIGERLPGSGRRLDALYEGIVAPRFFTSLEVAELAKHVDNSFHAIKVAFANEIGRYALLLGLQPREVFEAFLADTQLNLSARYLSPGGAFGGPCLPKDVAALSTRMRMAGADAPLLDRVLESNEAHKRFILDEIARRAAPPARVLLLGLTFKNGTGDLRESPQVELAGALLDRGYRLAIHDPDLGDAASRALLRNDVAAAILDDVTPTVPPWDLVVLAKTFPEAAATIAGAGAAFDIQHL